MWKQLRTSTHSWTPSGQHNNRIWIVSWRHLKLWKKAKKVFVKKQKNMSKIAMMLQNSVNWIQLWLPTIWQIHKFKRNSRIIILGNLICISVSMSITWCMSLKEEKLGQPRVFLSNSRSQCLLFWVQAACAWTILVITFQGTQCRILNLGGRRKNPRSLEWAKNTMRRASMFRSKNCKSSTSKTSTLIPSLENTQAGVFRSFPNPLARRLTRNKGWMICIRSCFAKLLQSSQSWAIVYDIF